MQRTKKLVAYSLISGCVWAAIGLAIAWLVSPVSPVRTPLGEVPRTFGGGLVAAPVIGVLIGRMSRNFLAFRRPTRLAIALANVYLASLLFLMAVNLPRLFEGHVARPRVFSALISGPIFGAIFGLTYTGFVLVLWPLSYANHSLIGRAWKRS
jgi:hypothetical protein